MSADDTFYVLIEKCLDGNLTVAERGALTKLMAENEALRREFLLAVSEEAALKSIHAQAEAVPKRKRSKPIKIVRSGQYAWTAALSACALLAVGVLIYIAYRTPDVVKPIESGRPVATLQSVTDGVSIARNGGAIAASANMSLLEKDEIRCAAKQTATVAYADATLVELKPESRITVDATTDGGKCVRVERGGVHATVAKQPAGQPMRFQSSHAEAIVLGTQLDFDVTDSATTLSVAEGKVRFSSALLSKSLDVLTQETATAGKDVPFAVTRITPPAPPVPAAPIANRIQDGLAALYVFNEHQGNVVHDLSGHGEALDLKIAGDDSTYSWLKDGGLDVHGAPSVASEQPAAKVVQACKNTGALTVEAWFKAAPITVNSLNYVFALRGDDNLPEFELAQHKDAFHANWGVNMQTFMPFHHGQHNGAAAERTGPSVPALESLMHWVFTRDAAGNVAVYVNGEEQAHAQLAGDYSRWDEQHRLYLAGDGRGRVWKGEFHLFAVYGRALSASEIKKNFAAGMK